MWKQRGSVMSFQLQEQKATQNSPNLRERKNGQVLGFAQSKLSQSIPIGQGAYSVNSRVAVYKMENDIIADNVITNCTQK